MFYLNEPLSHNCYDGLYNLFSSDTTDADLIDYIDKRLLKLSDDNYLSALLAFQKFVDYTYYGLSATEHKDHKVEAVSRHIEPLINAHLIEPDIAFMNQLFHLSDLSSFKTDNNQVLNYAIDLVLNLNLYDKIDINFPDILMFDQLPIDIKLWTMYLICNVDMDITSFKSEQLYIVKTFYSQLFDLDQSDFINNFEDLKTLIFSDNQPIISPDIQIDI